MRAVFGGVDVLIAAAGVQGPIGPFLESKPKAWNETMEINLIGVANSCRAALPPMIEQRSRQDHPDLRRRRGQLAAQFHARTRRPRRRWCASARTWRTEVRDHNVQVNAIAPGAAYST